MKTIIVAFRSLFKKGRNNLVKIISLSVGLAVGLVLIAKVYFEQTYDDFVPAAERIYQIHEQAVIGGELINHPQVSGAIAHGIKTEVPEVEAATRLTSLTFEELAFYTPDKKKYRAQPFLADSCLFDIFPLRVLTGDPKDILTRPMYAMVSKKIADSMGGVDAAVGQTIVFDRFPGRTLTIGGVFEDLPLNSHLYYTMLMSMNSIGQFMGDGSNIWVGNDRYMGYVRLMPGVAPESIAPGIRSMQEKNQPMERMKEMGFELSYNLMPLLDVHNGTPEAKRMAALLSILAFALIFTAVMNYILIVVSSLVGRAKEMAVNKCYGASEKNIYGKMLAETFAALLVSIVLAGLFVAFFRGTVEDLLGTSVTALLNWRSAAWLTGVCLLVFFISGFVPGFLFARVPVASAFRNNSENKRYWKLGLLFLQIVSAGFLLTLLVIINRQYNHLLNNNPGYAYEQMGYSPLNGISEDDRSKILEEVRRLPEVSGAATCTVNLISGQGGNMVFPADEERELFHMNDLYTVGNDYLKLMEIPLLEGRSFIQDVPTSNEVMVSRAFAERLRLLMNWNDGVTGKAIRFTEHGGPYTICGVFDNIRIGAISNEETRPMAMFYSSAPSNTLVVKYHRQTQAANQQVAEVMNRLMPDRENIVYSYSAEIVNLYVGARKFRDAVMIGSIVTLIITLIGLVGYTKDEMNRRRKETAIRKVNGATLTDILRMFMKDINRIALPALIIGGGISAYVAANWQSQFSEKTALSPLLFVLCALGVLLIILSAVALNCYRAANENPALSIKSE
jgi:putative ABC transport system permease protein